MGWVLSSLRSISALALALGRLILGWVCQTLGWLCCFLLVEAAGSVMKPGKLLSQNLKLLQLSRVWDCAKARPLLLEARKPTAVCLGVRELCCRTRLGSEGNCGAKSPPWSIPGCHCWDISALE